jgi:hypothetical protein
MGTGDKTIFGNLLGKKPISFSLIPPLALEYTVQKRGVLQQNQNVDCAEKPLLAKIAKFLGIKTAYLSPKISIAGILDDYF